MIAAVLGTAAITAIAAAVALPAGVGTGVWLAEYSDGAVGRLVRSFVGHMVAVPSVVYGLAGAAVLGGLGGTVVAAGVTLGVLGLPLVVVATEQAVREVPDSFRQSARALGATRHQVVSAVVVPASGRRIAAGALLALVRCAGETAPLLLLGAALAPTDSGFAALPTRLFALASGPAAAEGVGIAVGLALIVVAVHVAAARMRLAGRPA